MKRPFLAIVSLMIGFVLCALLAHYLKLTTPDITHLFMSNMWTAMLLAPVLLTVLLMLTGAWKWQILVSALNKEKCTPEGECYSFFFRHYLWQNWVGLFVPPSLALIGGRGVAHRHTTGFKSGTLNGLFDQGLEFLFIAALIPLGFLFLMDRIGVVELVLLSPLFHLVLTALLYFFTLFYRPALKSFALPVLLLSSLRVFLTIIRIAFGALVFGLALSFFDIAASAPVVSLLALIPLTPGNLGIAEWGWTGVLVWSGSDVVAAGSLAIGFRILMMMLQTFLLGVYEGFLFLTRR